MDVRKELVRVRIACTAALPVFILSLNILAVVGYILLWAGAGGCKRRPLALSGAFYGWGILLSFIAGVLYFSLFMNMLDGGASAHFWIGAMLVCACSFVICIAAALWICRIVKAIPDDRPFFD